MATNHIIVDALTGGINTNVIKVIAQTSETSDTTINAVTNRGYICESASLQTINLPDTSLVGDIFYFQGDGAGLFRVAQKAGQQIIVGSKATTVGVTGYIESTVASDGFFIICTTAPGIFSAMPGYPGTLSIDGADVSSEVTADNVTSPGSEDHTLIGDGIGPALTFKTVRANQSLTNGVGVTSTSDSVSMYCQNPDQTTTLVAGTGIAVTGTYPNFTVAATGTGGGVNLTSPGNNVRIGGTYPNITVDVGNSSAGTSTVVINNLAPGTHGNGVVAIGQNAGNTGQKSYAVAIGFYAGGSNQGIRSIAIGDTAGENAQGDNAVAIGLVAGTETQGANAVAIGESAGKNFQGANAIAVGPGAGETSQTFGAVSVGVDAGNFLQGQEATAVGDSAGMGEQGKQACAFGKEAGKTSQGVTATAVGAFAGSISQGLDATAVGAGAGGQGQGAHSICLGAGAGELNALPYSVQIGTACASAGANGRLAFGNSMEPVTPIGAAAATQVAYRDEEWNGVHYRIPLFSPSSEAAVVDGVSSGVTADNVNFPGSEDHTLIGDGIGPALTFKTVRANQSLTNGVNVYSSSDSFYMACKNPDKTVAISAGDGIAVTGTYPNFTISSTGGSMAALIDTQVFTADGTWTKPAGAQFVNVLIIAGGGGGGSGPRVPSSWEIGAGLGGAYGGVTYVNGYDADSLPATQGVVIGAGGIGGPAQTLNTAAGIDGFVGGDSSFDVFLASGGDGGNGGIIGSDTSFDGDVRVVSVITYNGNQMELVISQTQSAPGDYGIFSTSDTSAPNISGHLCPSSGNSGQGKRENILGPIYAGIAIDYEYLTLAPKQAAAAAVNSPGNDGLTYANYFGTGASGGASTLSSIGYDGGVGGDYGGGGGGGGACINGYTSGAGGPGGPGVVVVHTYG